jgi:hypothetical protein
MTFKKSLIFPVKRFFRSQECIIFESEADHGWIYFNINTQMNKKNEIAE